MIKEIVNDDERLDLLAQLLEEAEEAKQVLRDKGYGWTGLSLLATVKEEVPSANNEMNPYMLSAEELNETEEKLRLQGRL